jgi:hypothetical protein
VPHALPTSRVFKIKKQKKKENEENEKYKKKSGLKNRLR